MPPNHRNKSPIAGVNIDSLVVIDRQVDMISPVCSQLTYEGLVDELVGIKAGAFPQGVLPHWKLFLTGATSSR